MIVAGDRRLRHRARRQWQAAREAIKAQNEKDRAQRTV